VPLLTLLLSVSGLLLFGCMVVSLFLVFVTGRSCLLLVEAIVDFVKDLLITS
jgi:hypothetical protein